MTTSLQRGPETEASPPFRLKMFGGLSVERDGTPVANLNAHRKRLALLALLAVAGESVPRDKLLVLLWAESTDEQARNALKQAVFGLRRELGFDAISSGPELRLSTALVTSDVADFLSAVESGELERAVALYRGPFLDGFGLKSAHDLEMWIDEERRRLAAMHATALERLAQRAEASGDTAAAVVWWRQCADADPLSARVAASLMRVLAANGDREAALQHAGVYGALVRAQLEVAPDPAIAALASELRQAPPQAPSHRDGPPATTGAPIDRAAPVAVHTVSAAKRRRWLLGAGLITCIAASIAFLAAPRSPVGAHTRPGDSRDTLPRVQITIFENRTGDSAVGHLGEVTADWVGEGIVRTGMLDVAPAPTAQWRSRTASGRSDSPSATPEALARLSGAGLVVTGDYYKVADTIYVESALVDGATGRLIGSPPAVVVSLKNPYPAIERVRQLITGLLAVHTDPRLARWATSASQPTTFAAYQEFSAGLSRIFAGEYAASLPHFERARQLDSNFMLPALWSIRQYPVERRREADSVVRYLEARRDRLTAWDRAMLDYQHSGLDGDPLRAYLAAQQMARLTPGSAWLYEAAGAALTVDRPRDAVEYLLKFDPSHFERVAEYWAMLATAYHRLGVFDSALVALDKMEQQRPDLRRITQDMRASVLGAAGRVDRVEAMIADDSIEPETKLRHLSNATEEAAIHGERTAAVHLAADFDRLYDQLPAEQRSRLEEMRASTILVVGRAREALAIARARSLPALAALAAAELGDRRTADSALAALSVLATNPRDLRPLAIGVRVAAIEGDHVRAQRLLGQLLRDGRWWQALHTEPGATAMRGYPPFLAAVARP